MDGLPTPFEGRDVRLNPLLDELPQKTALEIALITAEALRLEPKPPVGPVDKRERAFSLACGTCEYLDPDAHKQTVPVLHEPVDLIAQVGAILALERQP